MDNGTKVRVRKDLVVDQFYGGKRFHNGMKFHLGKEAIIKGKAHYDENLFHISIDLEGYDWTVDMLEVIGE